MAYENERRFIDAALDLLIARLPAESNDADLADAIDHLCTARNLLGGKPKDFPINLNPSDDEKKDVRDRLLKLGQYTK